MRSKLLAFVEGEGDREAVPRLISKVLTELPDDEEIWSHVSLQTPWTIDNIGKLAKDGFRDWTNKLQAATKDPMVKGILLLLDGDTKTILKKPFCAMEMARLFAEKACSVGAGKTFSVAVVFAICEYETWIIAGLPKIAGKTLPNQSSGLPEGLACPDNLEAIGGAKGWLTKHMGRKYKETIDQLEFTRLLDIATIKAKNLRAFQRFEMALIQLARAIKAGRHVATPPSEAIK